VPGFRKNFINSLMRVLEVIRLSSKGKTFFQGFYKQ